MPLHSPITVWKATVSGGKGLETEALLAKLRQLRYQSDYSMHLFMAAIGELEAPQRPAPSDGRTVGRCFLRGWGPGMAGWSRPGCPHCGYRGRVPRLRRS